MAKKRHGAEQIIPKLRVAEAELDKANLREAARPSGGERLAMRVSR